MEQRINMAQDAPEAYKAVLGLNKYLETTTLTTTHKELIKIRASQINGCAFCIDMHAHDALKYGETAQRLYVLSAWRETGFFTEEERAVLALTEEITLIGNKGVSDEAYRNAVRLLGEDYVAHILMAVATINVWNRIAIATHLKPALR